MSAAQPGERCAVCRERDGQLVLSHDGPDGYLVHPACLADPEPFTHPAWCSHGPQCQPPRLCNDGSRDWAHARFDEVEHKDGVADVYLVWMGEVDVEGVRRENAAVVLTANGSFDADQAEQFGRACLRAAELLRVGLAPAGGPR